MKPNPNDPCTNPSLPEVILSMPPDFRHSLGRSIPLPIGFELAVVAGGQKFQATCVDQVGELVDGVMTITCKLQRSM